MFLLLVYITKNKRKKEKHSLYKTSRHLIDGYTGISFHKERYLVIKICINRSHSLRKLQR